MPNSTPRKGSRNPRKPRADFPLSIHKGTGYWCKKVLGTVYYFGRVADDPKGVRALAEWLEEKDSLLAGRGRRAIAAQGGKTVRDLCNKFMESKDDERDNGELSPRTWATYYSTCADLTKALGKYRLLTDLTPDDFRKLKKRLARNREAVALRNVMQRVRSVFKFAFEEGFIDRPVNFGQGFKKPRPDVVDRAREAHRAEHGDMMFEANEIRLMLDALAGKEVAVNRIDKETGQPERVKLKPNAGLRAMVLLAANCGFGQTDLANLTTRSVNLETGIVDFGRGKTGAPRKIPLWPETIAAIQEWQTVRPKAKDKADAGLLFVTIRGARFLRVNPTSGHHTDGIGQEFQKLIKKLELKRPRIGIYSLRHGFETIAGETADQVAVDAVMGHKQKGMGSHYRERISAERVQRVVDHVRGWLFAAPAPEPASAGSANLRTQRTSVRGAAPAEPAPAARRSQRTQKSSERPQLRIVG